jgi:GNAT superfamily N-acetyltransferase
MRFFGYKKGLTESELAQATDVDFDQVVALVATVGSSEDERIIAGGRYIADTEPDRGTGAEIAFIVVKEYRGLGIAQHLLRHLIRIARYKGVSRLAADVLVANRPMLLVLARSGLPMTQHRSGDVAHVTLLL